MGVSGCGKSTVGADLARRQGLPFLEADGFHPLANVEKMSRGIPLNDEDRWPWLAVLGAAMRENAVESGGVIASCSALKRAYRSCLSQHVGLPMLFALLDGDRETLFARMSARKDHYMPASLLDSQLADLERPAPDEPAVSISFERGVDDIVGELEAIAVCLSGENP